MFFLQPFMVPPFIPLTPRQAVVVGAFVGNRVGRLVGASVRGFFDGAFERCFVGASAGAPVGAFVGAFVGGFVGGGASVIIRLSMKNCPSKTADRVTAEAAISCRREGYGAKDVARPVGSVVDGDNVGYVSRGRVLD